MILVDGMLLIRRSHAKMDFLKNSEGTPTGMEYGFLKTLKSIERKLGDSDIRICWDSKNSVRKKLCPEYKANRTKSLGDEFWTRLNRFKSIVTAVYPSYWSDGYEADDVLAKLARGGAYIYSNDKDLLQAVYDGTYLVTSRESQLWLWDEEEVLKEFGVSRQLYMYYKAFLGDSGDNVVGVPGVRKTVVAAKLRDGGPTALFHPDGYRDKEYEAVVEFGVDKWRRNCELVKLHDCEVEILPKAEMSEFNKYMETLEIRSLSYAEF